MDSKTVEKRVKDAAKRQGWLDSTGIVVALSGGGDSVALLWLLKTYFKGRIVAAHLDHCTREGASHEDADFCANLCRDWRIDIRIKKVEVYANKKKGESFEMAGRRERYRHFFEIAYAEKLPYIALGHSADDLVETQLINLFRGTGLAGLRGIPEVRGEIVRPVIGFWRRELRRILIENGVEWREDASNRETLYLRNRVREELLPWVRKNFNINFEANMLGLAAQIDGELSLKQKYTQKNLEKVSVSCYPALACWAAKNLDEFNDLELADMLRMQAKKLGLPTLSRRRMLELLVLLRRGGKWRFQWSADIEVCYSLRGIGWLHRQDVEKNPGDASKNRKQNLPWWVR